MNNRIKAYRREDFLITMVGAAAIVYGTTLVCAAVVFVERWWPALVHLAQF